MWYVWYNGERYMLTNDAVVADNSAAGVLVTFKIFDMAYDYVTTKNKIADLPAYSRWTVNAR